MGWILILAISGVMTWWVADQLHLHGDLLYFETFYQDQFVMDLPWKDFAFTEAPFLFPDFTIMTFIRSFVPSAEWSILVYQVIFLLVLAWMLRQCGAKVFTGQEDRFPLHFGVMLLVVATTPIYRTMAFVSHHHGAVWLFFLFWFWQLGDLAEKGSKNLTRWLSLNFALAALFTFSDLISLPSVVAPALVSLWILTFTRRIEHRTAIHVSIVTVIGVLSGLLVQADLIHLNLMSLQSADVFELSLAGMVTSLKALPPSLVTLIQMNKVLFLVFASVAAIHIFKRQRTAAKSDSLLHIFMIFSSVTLIVKASSLVVSSRWPDVNSMRYFQEIYFLPMTWLALWGLNVVRLPSRHRLTATLALTFAALGFVQAVAVQPKFFEKPSLTACLDDHAAELPTPWGLGPFWVARWVTFTSDQKLHMNQVDGRMNRYFWMNSAPWYRRDIFQRPITKHSYYVSNVPRHTEIAHQTWGPPESTFTCPSMWGELTVLVYPRGIEPKDVTPAIKLGDSTVRTSLGPLIAPPAHTD